MLEIERKRYIFKTKEIWFSPYPFDIRGYDNVTFLSCKNMVDIKGFTREEFATLVVDLTQGLDVIWKNMNRTCRKAINRAKKKGVKIKISQDFEDFLEIDHSFKKAKCLPQASYTTEFMKKYGTLFVAEFNGGIFAGHFYLEDENNIRSFVMASKRLEVNTEKAKLIGDTNRLIIWEAINYAKNKGIKEFDMGGYYIGKTRDEQLEKVNFFKQSFGGKLATRYSYRKNYSKIYRLAKKIYQFKQMVSNE